MTHLDDSALYRWMLLCSEVEAAVGRKNPGWFPVGGEEAVIVGSFAELQPGDVAAPHYRGPFVVYMMRGAELARLMCQALGRTGGYNKGRSVPFTGSGRFRCVPWVAGDLGTTLGTATGAALGLQQEGGSSVCVCSFGDGTANRGDFHENINLAALWKLPIVYVCQNNGWAISQRAKSYLPAPIVDRAAGYGIPGEVVDGNDVEAVRDVVLEASERARNGEGPTLIEARTWRKGGHWVRDKAAYRNNDEHEDSDPLDLLAERLEKRGRLDRKARERMRREVIADIDEALDHAERQPEAGEAELGLAEVYA